MGMIGSLGTYDVVSLYTCFMEMLFGFGNLLDLVELEGFSSDSLVMCGFQRVLYDFYHGSRWIFPTCVRNMLRIAIFYWIRSNGRFSINRVGNLLVTQR